MRHRDSSDTRSTARRIPSVRAPISTVSATNDEVTAGQAVPAQILIPVDARGYRESFRPHKPNSAADAELETAARRRRHDRRRQARDVAQRRQSTWAQSSCFRGRRRRRREERYGRRAQRCGRRELTTADHNVSTYHEASGVPKPPAVTDPLLADLPRTQLTQLLRHAASAGVHRRDQSEARVTTRVRRQDSRAPLRIQDVTPELFEDPGKARQPAPRPRRSLRPTVLDRFELSARTNLRFGSSLRISGRVSGQRNVVKYAALAPQRVIRNVLGVPERTMTARRGA